MHDFPQHAILLAAGLGTRLRPLTERVAKPALPVGSIPLLIWNLEWLRKFGVREVVINLYHLPESIVEALQAFPLPGLKIHLSYENKILGTAGGVAQALRYFKAEHCWIVNGDIIHDIDLPTLAKLHRLHRAAATLATVSSKNSQIQSFIESDVRQKIWRIAGAPQVAKLRLKPSIFCGLQLIATRIFNDYPLGKFGCLVRQVYQPLLVQGGILANYEHSGAWWDLGSLEQLKSVDALLWRRAVPAKILTLWEQMKRLAIRPWE